MKQTISLILFFLISIKLILGQSLEEIKIPICNDKFCEIIKLLENGETNIDYKEFRFSFIESEHFMEAQKLSKKYDDLKKEMYSQMKKSNYEEIIKITKEMLSINYTSMIAHKVLRQTYEIIGETEKAQHYKAIQFGLLYSIVKNGDGKSCETAWPVISLEEEYFILEMLGAELKKQRLVDGHCDKMEVKVDSKRKVYFFEVSKIFEGYKKLGLK